MGAPFLQYGAIGNTETNTVIKHVFTVSSTPSIVIPVATKRKLFTIFHDTNDAELLIDFGNEFNPLDYALKLPAYAYFFDNSWQGQVRAVSSGSEVKVYTREFF